MLSPEGILLWYSNRNTSADSRNLIDRIRTSEPSRLVRNGASNVSGRYPSKKMGRVIQFETHRVELAGIYEMENDPDVLEFYDQPQPVMLSYPNQTGRLKGVWHTPDFFVIRRNSAGWDDWMTQEKLESLSEDNPDRYRPGKSGSWTFPPGEAYSNRYNLYYHVHSSVEINHTYLRNVVYLEDYL